MQSVYRSPRSHEELHSFVANFGARCVRATTTCQLENVVLRAVSASRKDPSLSRMLPVFLWRVRKNLNLEELTAKAVNKRRAQVLGYYLDLAGKVGSTKAFSKSVKALRPHVRADRPVFLFPETAKHPFEVFATKQDVSDYARKWGLLARMPLEGYKSYFSKVAHL